MRVVSKVQAHEDSFPAMGTTAHVVVRGGDDGIVGEAAAQLLAFEALWSRFIPTSDVSRLNQAMGEPVKVSEPTVRLVAAAIEAWKHTGGAFDPTVYDSLVGLGYNRTFSQIRPPTDSRPQHASPGCNGIEIDSRRSRVRLPRGVRFDPGGIGKGLAADLVAGHVMASGASGVVVNVGGDLCTRGSGIHDGWWLVEIDEPATGARSVRVLMDNAALASSTPSKRRWPVGPTEAHHLIDPATGNPAETQWALVTAIAGEAWWAEAATKALILNGPRALPAGVSACMVGRDGSSVYLGDFSRFVR